MVLHLNWRESIGLCLVC